MADSYIVEIAVVGGKLSVKELDRVNGSLKKMDKNAAKATKRFSKMGRDAKIAFAAVSAGAILMGKSFTNAAAEAENYRVRLNVLLGSQEEGNRMFKEMAEFAGKVPFEYRQVMNSATQLAGVMKGGVDEVKAWMPLIADLAATAGLGIEEATGQVVRMYSAGAGAADLFRDRGILAMLGFKAKVAVTAEETRDVMIKAWTDSNSKFRGATDQLAETWTGKVSMMNDAWFQFQTAVMEGGLLDYMKDIVDEMTSIVRWINTGTRAASRAEEMAIQQERLGVVTTQIERRRVAGPRGTSDPEYFRLLEEWNTLTTSIKVMTDYYKGTFQEEAPLKESLVELRDEFVGLEKIAMRVGRESAKAVSDLQREGAVAIGDLMRGGVQPVDVSGLDAAEPILDTYEQIYAGAESFWSRMVVLSADSNAQMGNDYENTITAFDMAWGSVANGMQAGMDAMTTSSGNFGKAFAAEIAEGVSQAAALKGRFYFLEGLATVWTNPVKGAALMAAGTGLTALSSLAGSLGGAGGGGGGRAAGGGGGVFGSGVDAGGGRRDTGGGVSPTVIIISANGDRSTASGALGRRMITDTIDNRQLSYIVKEMQRTGASLDMEG